MARTRYYFVSYAHSKGFGSIYYKATPRLNIKEAQDILEKENVSDVIILNIVRIHKSQYEDAGVTKTANSLRQLIKE